MIVALFLAGCGEEEPTSVTFRTGRVTYDGKTVALGETLEHWEEALGPSRDGPLVSEARVWDGRLLVNAQRTVCGDRRVVAARVALVDDPRLPMRPMPGAVELESCRFVRGDTVPSDGIRCGSFGTGTLTPVMGVYHGPIAGTLLSLTVRAENEVDTVSISLDQSNSKSLGLDLSEQERRDFVADGRCRSPRTVTVGAERRMDGLRKLRDLVGSFFD